MLRAFSIVLIFTFIIALAAPCFAAAPAIGLGVDFFSTLVTAYLSAAGLELLLKPDNVVSSSDDPASIASYELLTNGIYQDYVVSTGSVLTDFEAFQDTYRDSVQIMQGVNNEVVMRLGDDLTAELDKFGNWLLKDKYQLNSNVTGSGFVHSSGSFDSPLFVDSSFSYNGHALAQASPGLVLDNTYTLTSVNSSFPVYAFRNANYTYLVSDYPFDIWIRYGGIGTNRVATFVSDSNAAFPYVYRHNSSVAGSIPLFDFPLLNNLMPSKVGADVGSVSDVLGTRVKPKYKTKDIAVPDISSDTYLPAPKDLTLDIPFVPDFAGSLGLDNLLSVSVDKILANELSATDAIAIDQDVPFDSSGFSPFLPAQLPSFDFNFSGIWHYVVDWVGSLSAGLSAIFRVWNSLPVAMVLPVYGSLVAVIVIGVWRRFFE